MRPTNPHKIYLDSCTLITGMTKQPGYEPIQAIFDLAERRRVELYVSALVYVEVLGQNRSEPVDQQLEQEILARLDSRVFHKIDFYRGLALRARQYEHNHRLRPYDAVHLASAVAAEAEVLMTSDKRFKRPREVDGVWIDDPYEPGDPKLF